ncbi:MAG TPA: protein kinase [Polyangiaceae bacterium]|nr:protein kinase [Polyangiaceae bacterium]
MSALAVSTQKGPLDIGEHFLKFEIRGLLGHGGHGWVYHGYDPFLDRHVAIKVIPSPADRGRDLGRRAQLEARVLCKLQHHNVVHVIDAGATAGGAVYLVMELLHGRTLRDAIREYRQLNVVEALSLGAQIADGVQAAHEQNTIHRDLKPENVFIGEGNALKVLDFGIAKFLGSGAATTQRDLLHGTILYMSPEHMQGLRVTVRSDIYALGTTLYEALAGCPPCLVGMEEPTLESVTFAQINRMPLTLDVLTGTVPRFIARTIQRMIAKAPADRFATMAEVSQVLRANLERYAKEVPIASATPRKLWQGTHSISPTSGAIRLSHSPTDVHQLPPTTAPLADTLARHVRDDATPLQFSIAPAIRTDITAPMPRPQTMRATPAAQSTPPAQQAIEAEWMAAPGAIEDAPLPPVPQPALTLPQLLLCGVALGTFIGVAVALIQTYPRSAVPATSASISALRASAPPQTPPLSSSAASTTATALAVPAVPSSAAARTPIASSVVPPPRPHPTTRAVSKPVNIGPASGLAEASNGEQRANVAASAKPPTRRPKAIYGSNDGAE